MPVIKPRTRTVTFRVSADEFSSLMSSCVRSGARSLSEYARVAVLDKDKRHGEQAGLTGDLKTVSETLVELEASLLEVSKKIRGVLGRGPANGDRTYVA